MKMRKFVMLMASLGLVFGLMTGCGGGSSSDGDVTQPPAPPVAGLDDQKVNETATQLADTLGCDYTTVATAQSGKFNAAFSYKAVGALKSVLESDSVLKTVMEAYISAKTEETVPGSCGGSYLMVTEEDTSGTGGTIDITFDNYCDDTTVGVATTLNGSLNIVLAQSSETSLSITASTGTPLNIKTTNPNTSDNIDTTIDLQNGEVVINTDATSGDLTTIGLTASSVTITDNVTGESCTFTNVNVQIDMATQSATFAATVNCTGTDTGSIDVSGTADATGQVAITVTDENGKQGTLTSTDVEGVFDVSFDGAPLGTMDCSSVEVPELPVL